ncbi:hypothetical protein LCGC14_1270320 [marine sediment metagenome]|uniref:Uncharacterized protein n=1 Tax=marine sediment metagenome TaxID=412755 RepID=A0A0F9LJ92_9ZZZZ
MAWEMPHGIGLRYLHGDYICQPGWEASLVLHRPWKRGQAGYITRKALPAPGVEARVVRRR